MSLRTLTALVLLSLLVCPLTATAVDYGDGFGVGGVLLPSGAGTIVGKTKLGDNMALEIALSLSTWSDGDDSYSNIGFGAGVLFANGTNSQFQPYWGGRVSIGHTSGEGKDGDGSHTEFGVDAVLGAEYFITKRLSVEGEIGVGMRFGSFSLATGTTLAGFIYL